MKKSFTLACALLLHTALSIAQDNFLKDFAPVAPTPASLGKYGDIPVSYHTGVPNNTIPIHTLNEGSISVPVSLSYHSAGIRVQETASWVGLGWALNAGGIITRTVQGAPDEKGNIGQTSGWYTEKGNGRSGGQCPPLTHVASGWFDTEPDIFHFNVGGYTGKFFYDSDTILRIVPQQDVTIRTINIGSQIFSGWILTDPQGNRYHFGATSAGMTYSDYVEKSSYSTDYTLPTIPSSWYLSKIESADRKDVITFTYTTENYAFWEVSTSPVFGGSLSAANPNECEGGSVRAPIVARVIGKRLTSINGTNGSIVFTPESTARVDLSNFNMCTMPSCTTNTQAKALKTIEVRDRAGGCLRKFEFSYTYSNSVTPGSPPAGYLPSGTTPPDQTDLKRLVLLSVSEQACTTSTNAKTHTFEYYGQDSLPRRLSFAQDHWGYFNGKTSNTDLEPGYPYKSTLCYGCQEHYAHECTPPPGNREPAFPAMRNGTLKKITYPTGGSSAFDYEAHTIWTTDSTCTETNIDQFNAYSGSSCPSCQNCASGFTTRTYTFSAYQLDYGHIELTQASSCSTNYAFVEVYTTYPGTPIASTGTGFSSLKTIGGVTLVPGVSYTFKLVAVGSDPAYIRLYTLQRSSFGVNRIIGGLRIKSITTNDGDASTSNNIVKRFEYKDPLNTARSSGKLVHKPLYVAIFRVNCTNVDSPACGSDSCNFPRTNENYYTACPLTTGTLPFLNYVLSYSSLQPMQTTMGSHIGYIGVQVKETGNGQSEFQYNMGQYANGPWVPKGYPFPPPPYEPLVGTLASETHYTEAGLVVQSAHYQYTASSVNVIDTTGYDANKVYKAPNGLITTQFYNMNTGYVLLTETRGRQYNTSGTYVETLTTLGYTTANGHLQKTTEDITNSDGTIYRTKYKYPLDYPCPPSGACTSTNLEMRAIYEMRARNMIALPIEQTTWLKKSAWGAFRLTGATYFQFDKVNTDYNNLKLKAIHQIRPVSPLTSFTESSGGATSFTKDGAYVQEYNFVFSDNHGKLLGQWKQHDPAKQQYVWGHGQKLPIAKVINAESNEIAYTGFERRAVTTAENGYWQISGADTPTTDWPTTASQTGKTCLKIGSRAITASGLPAGKYRVSYWYRDGVAKVNTVTVGTTVGSTWTYAETLLTFAGGGNVITISSSSANTLIDELRLHPDDALMQTFSFDDNSQLLLSIADENSVPAHYDYDNFQRLQGIRDQDRNLLQTYEYNYQASPALNNIKTRTVLTSGQTTLTQVNALTGANVKGVFQYLDGLGRPLQTNAVGQSPAQNDVIAVQQYDAFGREPKQYLPYTYTTNSGAYRTAALTEQNIFANTFGAANYGFSEQAYESSPLNRVVEQGFPGATWRVGAPTPRTLRFARRGNTTADAVRDFTNNTTYPANSLWVTQETDENTRIRLTFTDKLGRVVLVRQQMATAPSSEDNDYARTYTVYDDFGRVAAVLPPETSKKMKTSGNWDYTATTYESMTFRYTYDSRGRMATKTVPSGGTTTLSYDRLDRLVLTRDARSTALFTRYDILSRPVVSGRYKGAAAPGGSDPLYETPNTTGPHYFTTTAFPTDNNLDVYKIFYYDDIDLDNNGSLGAGETYTNPAESGYETAAFTRTRGKPTAVKTAVLKNDNTAPTLYLTACTWYDREYRVIQVNKQNHLGGADVLSSAYDFADRVLKTRRDHTATPPGGTLKTYAIREEYVYDHAGRLRFARHKINANNWVVTTAPLYDELDRLADKRLHASNYDGTSAVTLSSNFNYLQSLDYTYNIRGWLTAINNPASCAVQSGDHLADMFSLGLEYESSATGGVAQYNGNIATLQWNTYINSTCGTRQLYRFSYDAANRLTAADHRTWSGTAWTDPNRYNESGITYDLNGNIKAYIRQGVTSGTSTFGTIDQLTYHYEDALRPDKLTRVVDAGSATKGFRYVPPPSGHHYFYDNNGNLIADVHKSLSVSYNPYNLAANMLFTDSGGAEKNIEITYDADGKKLTKKVINQGTTVYTQQYIGGIEYRDNNTEAIYHAEGRCTPNGSNFYYEYMLKDHLGSTRVWWRANGTAVITLQEAHYYPFGMEMEGSWTAQTGTENQLKFNGIEFVEDWSLNIYTAFFRSYDPAIGRWWRVDPKPNFQNSLYSLVNNNPIRYTDFLGDTLRAVNSSSASRSQAIIQQTFYDMGTIGFSAAGLFQIGNDGLTFKSISRKDFNRATKGMNRQQKALARGYYRSINGRQTHTIEVVARSERLSNYSREIFQSNRNSARTGADVDNNGGGGAAYTNYYDGKVVRGEPGAHVVVVMNAAHKLPGSQFSDGVARASSAGELLAHELLGHGLAGISGNTDGKDEAIQATNLYLHSTNQNYYRVSHGTTPNNPNTDPQGIPIYLQEAFNPFQDK